MRTILAAVAVMLGACAEPREAPNAGASCADEPLTATCDGQGQAWPTCDAVPACPYPLTLSACSVGETATCVYSEARATMNAECVPSGEARGGYMHCVLAGDAGR